MTPKKLAAAIARSNPLPELEDVYDAYLDDPTSNRSHEEWWSRLHQIGLDGDETAEYLENVANRAAMTSSGSPPSNTATQQSKDVSSPTKAGATSILSC